MFGKSTAVTVSVMAAVGLSVAGVVAAAVVGSAVGKTGLMVVGPAPTASVVSGGLMLVQPEVAATETPECSVGGMYSMANVVSVGAGRMMLNLTLVNVSAHACTIEGFPGLQLQDENHEDQTTSVIRDELVPKTVITLASQESASTTIGFDSGAPTTSEPKSGACEPPSLYLLVTPPNNSAGLVTPIGSDQGSGITVCRHGALDVLPFVPGKTGARQ
jgi:hypothetical protein